MAPAVRVVPVEADRPAIGRQRLVRMLQERQRANVPPVFGAFYRGAMRFRFQFFFAGHEFCLQLRYVDALWVLSERQEVHVPVLGEAPDGGRNGGRLLLLRRDGLARWRRLQLETVKKLLRYIRQQQLLHDLAREQLGRIETLPRDDALAARHHALAERLLACELPVAFMQRAGHGEIVRRDPDVARAAGVARPVVLHFGDGALFIAGSGLPAAPEPYQANENIGPPHRLAAKIQRIGVLRAEFLLPDAEETPRAHQLVEDRLAVFRQVHRGRA